ncbi:hypothetical protein VTP01DRAFT_9200, partial [Rhizomucor pusillus]|uniref:uncharacterized protein n=1 Tax=Rhizomucor pusillus TaxID=4840 RepID=UPI003741F1FD
MPRAHGASYLKSSHMTLDTIYSPTFHWHAFASLGKIHVQDNDCRHAEAGSLLLVSLITRLEAILFILKHGLVKETLAWSGYGAHNMSMYDHHGHDLCLSSDKCNEPLQGISLAF